MRAESTLAGVPEHQHALQARRVRWKAMVLLRHVLWGVLGFVCWHVGLLCEGRACALHFPGQLTVYV